MKKESIVREEYVLDLADKRVRAKFAIVLSALENEFEAILSEFIKGEIKDKTYQLILTFHS